MRALDWFVRSPQTGKVVIAQAPNLPLWIFLAATAVRLALRPDGAVGDVVSVVGGVSLAWWSTDEVLRGESPCRRVLGAVVLTSLALRLVLG